MPAPFQPIQGQLPWSGMTNLSRQFQGLSGTPQQAMGQLGDNYANAYNSALATNESLYNNILGGYQQTALAQQDAQGLIGRGYTDAYDRLNKEQQGVLGAYGTNLGYLQQGGNNLATGYSGLEDRVLGTIGNVGQSRARDIDAAATAQSGRSAQRLISSGLGNSTVQASLQRGISSDRERSQNALAEQIAQMRAGYQSQIGQAGLSQRERQLGAENAQRNLATGYQGQAARDLAQQSQIGLQFDERAMGQNAQLAQNQLGWMNTVQAPYPQSGQYAQLAQMFGAQQAQQADQARLNQLMQQAAQRQQQPQGVDPRTGVMPGVSRGSGGGPPPTSVGQGSGMNFLGGAGGFVPPAFGNFAPPSIVGAGGGYGSPYSGYAAGGFGVGAGAFGGAVGSYGQPEASYSAGGFGDESYAGAGGGLSGGFSGGLGDGYGAYVPGYEDAGWGGGVGALAGQWADQPFDEFGYYDY
jgi:hypothetical protein